MHLTNAEIKADHEDLRRRIQNVLNVQELQKDLNQHRYWAPYHVPVPPYFHAIWLPKLVEMAWSNHEKERQQ